MAAVGRAYGAAGGEAKAGAPFERRGNSATLTAGIIVADVVGAGVLSMAVAVKHLGWLLGTAAILVLLAMNVHVSIVLWRVSTFYPEARTLTDLTAAAFESAPAWAQKWAVRVVAVTQHLFLFLMLGLYTLSVGKGLGMVFYDVHICLPVWTLAGCAIILPIHASSRVMGTWQSLIWLNCTTILGTIFIPLGYMASQGVEATRPASSHMMAIESDLNFHDTLLSLSTLAFAFCGQFILVEIISEMRDPTEFPRAYAQLSAPFQGLAFLIVGLGGYYCKGSSVVGMIGDNIPFGGWYRLSAGLLATHMLITYLIKGVVVARAFFVMAAFGGGRADDDSAGARSAWCAVVAAVLALSLLISQLVPFFTDLVDLLGASLVPFCCWVVPIALYVRCTYGRRAGRGDIGALQWATFAAEVGFAVVLTIAGTYFSVGRIIGHWEEYGGPFSCHCERMWATCDCSAYHPGMEECLIPAEGS